MEVFGCTRRARRLANLLLVVGVWGVAGHAWAQPAGTAGGDQATSPAAQGAVTGQTTAADTLQEVVVTAERRTADIQTTPISVSAVSGDQLKEQNLNSVQSLQTVVPNLTVNDEGGFFESYNIRGIGNTAITPSITTGVAVFRDGLLLSETIGQNAPLYDIQDTEVLRGPQGTFVGASSTGGAVQINSQNPNFRGVNGDAEISGGNYSAVRADGAVNLPATDTLALRLAFDVEGRGSFYRDAGAAILTGPSEPIADPGRFDSRNLRLGVLWRPSDNFQALLKLEYNYMDEGGTPYEPNQLTYTTLFSNGGPPPPGVFGGPACSVGAVAAPFSAAGNPHGELFCPLSGAVTHSTYYAYSTHQPFVLNYDTTNLLFQDAQTHDGLELRYTLPDGIVVRSLSGFQSIDIHDIQPSSDAAANAGQLYQEIGPHDNYYSEELNLISPTTGRVNWIAGAFAYYRNTPVLNLGQTVLPPYGQFQPPAVQAFISYASVQRADAIFGQVNWQFTDNLQATLGARENWDSNFNYLEGPSGIFLYPSGIQLAPFPVTGHQQDSVPTGKVGLNWTPAPGEYIYAFWARGYKSGGVSVSPGALASQPEHVDDYELGWKGTLLAGHLQTQLGAYYMNYKNMQYQIFDITEAQGLTVANLSPSTIEGIEFSTQARIAHLGFNLGLAYNHSSLGALTSLPSYRLPPGFNSPVPSVQCGSPLAATSVAPCFNYLPYEETVSGEQNPFSPEVTGNASIDYAIPVGAGTLDPRITYSYTDKQWVSIFQDSPYNLLPSYQLWGANLDYLLGPWTVAFYVTNLANTTYVSGTDGGNNVFYGAPRQWGFRLRREF